MAFFKFRKGGDDASAPSHQPGQPESVEAMRKRARQRLIGAVVLVLAGVIGFPLVFDTQPRPIAVDIPIDIPDRAKSRPAAPATPAVGAVETAEPPVAVKADPASAAPAAAAATPAPAVPPAFVPAPAAPAPAAAPVPAPAVAAETRSEPPSRPAGDGDRAKALLEGQPVAAASAAAEEARFVVQVGAFADAAKATATRQKLEKAGLKTYTHVAETKEGKRIRVRVGPFPTRAEADKAAAKVKGLDLPAAVLTL